MKNHFFRIILFVLSVIPSFAFSQDRVSLKETIDFLKPKLKGRHSSTSWFKYYYDCSMDFDYKTCTMKYKIDGDWSGDSDIINYSIPLKSINFKNIIYHSKGFTIELKVNNEETLITKDEVYNGHRDISKEKVVFLYYLDRFDETNSERIKNALINAIKLCGGKGEAF